MTSGGEVVVEDFFHVLGKLARMELHIDFVVASHGQAVDVSSTDCRPHAVDAHRLGVNHGVLVEPDFDAFAKQGAVVGACYPVGHDVVGVFGDQNLDFHSAFCCCDQGLKNLFIWDEVGGGNQNVAGRALDCVDVHSANRVEDSLGCVECSGDFCMPLLRSGVGQLGCTMGFEVIPEIDESVF